MSRFLKNTLRIKEGINLTCDKSIITVSSADKKKNISIDAKDVRLNFISDKEISVSLIENAANKAMGGTVYRKIWNANEYISSDFSAKLKLEGVGYKISVKNRLVSLALGYSHDITLEMPDNIVVLTSDDVNFEIKGFDKEAVTSFAARIKSLRKLDLYKGKGIHSEGQVIKRKVGKRS